MRFPELPILAVLEHLGSILRSANRCILTAPPGTGKSTIVPLALLDEPWMNQNTLVLLEPRRLAAVAIAARLAELSGSKLGGLVGYHIRGERRASRATRVLVVTEGLFTRRIQADPCLEGVGAVLFDEFHERGANAEFGLALALESQQAYRPDVRLLVMSATLPLENLQRRLSAEVVHCEATLHPVTFRYLGENEKPLPLRLASLIPRVLEEHPGDVLCFLPGASSIRRTAAALAARALPGIELIELYRHIATSAQRAALLPSPPGIRKVVLATSIAETSLTIPGVQVILDSGLTRRNRYIDSSGLERLETIWTSRSSSIQRAGRAGRTGPGICYRLYYEQRFSGFLEHLPAEILTMDPSQLLLEALLWGVPGLRHLPLLDYPTEEREVAARHLLAQLGAITLEESGARITVRGRAMAELGLPPRLANLVLTGREQGWTTTACRLAALFSEGDFLRGPGCQAELSLRLEVLAGVSPLKAPRRLEELAADLLHRAGGTADASAPDTSFLVAATYPDRVAMLRPGSRSRYLLRNGREVSLGEQDQLGGSPFLAVAEIDDQEVAGRIILASPLERETLDQLFGSDMVREGVIEPEETLTVLRARQRLRLGALVLEERIWHDPPADSLNKALLSLLRKREPTFLDRPELARLRNRIAFARDHAPKEPWPQLEPQDLLADLEQWLAPSLHGKRSLAEVEELDLTALILASIPGKLVRLLAQLAPSHWETPTGHRVRIEYEGAPRVALRLQEVLGSQKHPMVGGKIPLVLELLSPAGRPLQVTADLPGFWTGAYLQVRKEMRGRYPKHVWPEDPARALPSRHGGKSPHGKKDGKG